MTTRRIVQLLGAIPLLAATIGCGGEGTAANEERQPPPLVEAVPARSGSLPLVETVHGVVRAENQVAIRPEIAAPVEAVLVRSGAAVERDQPLVRLRGDELRDRLRQAEADLRLAEATAAEARARKAELEARVRRVRALSEDGLVSEEELETQEARLAALGASAEAAQARVEQARAMVEERRSALAKTVVRAPVSGRVGERRVEVGMLVGPSTLLFVVGDLDRMMVEVPLTEESMARVEEGQTVLVETRGADSEPIRANLSRVSPFLAEGSFTTVGEIDLDNPGDRLRPGMFVRVRIRYGESRRATLVPASALWEDPDSGTRGIFVVEETAGLVPNGGPRDEEASETVRATSFRPVEILAEGGGTVGVEGIDEDDWVVIVGQHLLREEARDGGMEDGTATTVGTPTVEARVRPTSWERVESLQDLQPEDLLAEFLDKQRRISKALGTEIPESEDVVDRILRDEDSEAGNRSSRGEG